MSLDPGLLIASVAGPTVVGVVLLVVRVAAQRGRDRARATFILRFPSELDFDGLVAFLRALAGLLPRRRLGARPSATFEIVACSGRIEHRLRLPDDRAHAAIRQLYAALPGMLAEPPADADLRPRYGRELRLNRRDRPLRTDDPIRAAAAILAGCNRWALRRPWSSSGSWQPAATHRRLPPRRDPAPPEPASSVVCGI